MKVMLINPNRSYSARGTAGIGVGLPLGLLYLAATLERAGIQVKVFDCLISAKTYVRKDEALERIGVDADVLRAAILAEQPDIIGIGCPFTAQWDNAVEAIDLAREIMPNSVIVLGGPHVTAVGRPVLEQYPQVDYVIAGEGELSFPQLVGRIRDHDTSALSEIPGLIWRGEDRAIHANRVEPIENIDDLPLPAYHLIDVGRLFELQAQGVFSRYKHQHSAAIITSRGCPYTCTFCSIQLSMGSRFRAHSVDYVIHHLRVLIDGLKVHHLHFEDDNLTFKRSRAIAIFRRMSEEGFDVTWDTPNGVRADTLNDELLGWAKKSGCVALTIAAESGDQQVVTEIVKKKIDLKSIEHAAALAHKHQIPMGCFFVIGFPGETKKNIRQTLLFAAKLCLFYHCWPYVNVATPLPGTELEQMAQQNGYLVRETTARNYATATSGKGQGMIKTADFDPAYLKRMYFLFAKMVFCLKIGYVLTHPKQLGWAFQRKFPLVNPSSVKYRLKKLFNNRAVLDSDNAAQ